MFIERLDLSAFGRFTNVSVDLSAGPKRFHLIYGPNESGKSTSLRAITSWLFGMSHITDDNFLHPNAQMRVGGVLSDSAGRRLECIRRRGRKATLRGADDTETIDESRLQAMLGGITRDTFLARFGLSHEELVAGGTAILSGEGDLGQMLFAAGAGVGKLRDIQSELDESADKLFKPRGSKGINASIGHLDEQKRALRGAQVPPAEFADLHRRIEEKRTESKKLADAMQQCLVRLARLRNTDQALPLLPAWRNSIESLQKLKATPTLDEAFTERRRQAISDREVAISRQTEFETRIAELATRVEALPVDSVVMQHETEIQAVFQEAAARDKADRDCVDLKRVQKNIDRKITDLLHELSVEIRGVDEGDRAEAIDESVQRLKVTDSLRSRVRELASSYELLIGKRNDASTAVETAKRRLSDTIAELESLGTPGDPESLTGALEAIGNPQTLLDGLAEQQEAIATLTARCQEQVQKLDGFGGTLRQAITLQPPSESTVRKNSELLKTSYQKLLTAQEAAGQIQSQHDELVDQSQQDQSELPLPTVEELTVARETRDQATDALADAARSGQGVQEAIGRLRQMIRKSDDLADTIRVHSEHVHRREAQAAQVNQLQAKLERANRDVESAKLGFQGAKENWLSLWEACDVTAGQPERMQRWIADHEQLRELAARLGEDEKRLEQTEQRVRRAASRLRSVLAAADSKKRVAVSSTQQGGLFDDPPEEDLMSLYDDAVRLRSQSSRSRQQYDALARRRDELTEELPLAETSFEAAQKNVELWRDDWKRTTESFVSSERTTTREVLQMLDQIHELTDKKRERDILATRIRSIGEDELAYGARVKRLALATGEMLDEETTSSTVAHALYQRLQAQRKVAQGLETLREQAETSKQRLAEVAIQRNGCDGVLKQLCEEAGCSTPEELPEIEQIAKERSRLQTVLRDLENQLAILAGDQPIDEFIEAVRRQQPALLEVEIEQAEVELSELRESVARVQQETGAALHELSLMDGSSHASELVQTIQFTAGRIFSQVEDYARLKIASLILRRAIDHYRRENESPVLGFASGFFRDLTCGEYRELKPDFDAKGKSTLFGVTADAKEIPAAAMSAGTADSLYLALRLASLKHQMTQGESIPLIVDDCLIQLDDARAAACLKVLSDLSTDTQVILFTHHEHLLRLAESNLDANAFHTHRLVV